MTTATVAAPRVGPGIGRAMARAGGIGAALGELAELVRGAPQWSTSDRQALLERLDRGIDGLTAVRAAVLVAERDSGAWQRTGVRSFEDWRARTGRAGQRAATAQVRQAVVTS